MQLGKKAAAVTLVAAAGIAAAIAVRRYVGEHLILPCFVMDSSNLLRPPLLCAGVMSVMEILPSGRICVMEAWKFDSNAGINSSPIRTCL